MNLYELDSSNNIEKAIAKFLPFVKRELDLDSLPEIKLLSTPETTSFGGYNNKHKCIKLVTAGRHPNDILRTLAHELIHYKQDLAGEMHKGAGDTGSPQENEANAGAGIVMRNYNQSNPENLDEARSLRQAAGVRAGDTIDMNDILRLQGEITRLKKSNRASDRARGIRLERQLRTFRNTHPKKNYAVGSQYE